MARATRPELLETSFDSPLGELTVMVAEGLDPEQPGLLRLGGASGCGVCLLEFPNPPRLERERAQLADAFGAEPRQGAHPLHETVAETLAAYFAGDDAGCPSIREPGLAIPICAPGTEFQRAVWSALWSIPMGETTSYGALANAIDRTGAMRAVGAANGANRVSILLPCHRVIESGGGLRGYGGGLERKRWLLDHERALAGESLFAGS